MRFQTQPLHFIVHHVPDEVAKVCETVLYKIEDGHVNVREVVIEAKTKKELARKFGQVQRVSPEYIVLNGKVRPAKQVFETYFESKL